MSLIAKAFSIAGKATSAAINSVLSNVTETITSTNFGGILDRLDQTFTPILVEVTCNHASTDPEDYTLSFDLRAFEDALNAGKQARPRIVVRSAYPAIDRDILATKMETGLKPLIHNYEQHVDRQKKQILTKRDNDAFWGGLGLLILTLAGTVLGPIFWIIIGLEGWQALKSLPQLMIAGIKSSLYQLFFGDELEQLDKELETARTTIKRMVHAIKIEPLLP